MSPIAFASRLRYPDPLNPSAIEFTASDACTITLTVFDDGGNELRTILRGEAYPAGVHHISLDDLGLAAGRYLFRFTVLGGNGEVIETKMIERTA